jgi:carbonic anhydrase/acetyltransferase-like protein (isoleucine patch superfamily)
MPLLRRGRPLISKDVAFLAHCSTLIGPVYIGAGSSVFYKSILRADNCENAESFKRTDDEIIQEEWELDDERFSRQHTSAIGGGIFIGKNTNITGLSNSWIFDITKISKIHQLDIWFTRQLEIRI